MSKLSIKLTVARVLSKDDMNQLGVLLRNIWQAMCADDVVEMELEEEPIEEPIEEPTKDLNGEVYRLRQIDVELESADEEQARILLVEKAEIARRLRDAGITLRSLNRVPVDQLLDEVAANFELESEDEPDVDPVIETKVQQAKNGEQQFHRLPYGTRLNRDVVRQWMREKRLSQKDLADILGVSQTVVSTWIGARSEKTRGNPTMEHAIELSELSEIPLSHLIVKA